MLEDGWVEEEVIAAVVAVSEELAGVQRELQAYVTGLVRSAKAGLVTGASTNSRPVGHWRRGIP